MSTKTTSAADAIPEPMLDRAHSFKTRDGAVRHLVKQLSEDFLNQPGISWFVIAQEDGRFTPVVHLRHGHHHHMLALIDRKIAVVG